MLYTVFEGHTSVSIETTNQINIDLEMASDETIYFCLPKSW